MVRRPAAGSGGWHGATSGCCRSYGADWPVRRTTPYISAKRNDTPTTRCGRYKAAAMVPARYTARPRGRQGRRRSLPPPCWLVVRSRCGPRSRCGRTSVSCWALPTERRLWRRPGGVLVMNTSARWARSSRIWRPSSVGYAVTGEAWSPRDGCLIGILAIEVVLRGW